MFTLELSLQSWFNQMRITFAVTNHGVLVMAHAQAVRNSHAHTVVSLFARSFYFTPSPSYSDREVRRVILSCETSQVLFILVSSDSSCDDDMTPPTKWYLDREGDSVIVCVYAPATTPSPGSVDRHGIVRDIKSGV